MVDSVQLIGPEDCPCINIRLPTTQPCDLLRYREKISLAFQGLFRMFLLCNVFYGEIEAQLPLSIPFSNAVAA